MKNYRENMKGAFLQGRPRKEFNSPCKNALIENLEFRMPS